MWMEPTTTGVAAVSNGRREMPRKALMIGDKVEIAERLVGDERKGDERKDS